jgi:molybdopterin biosynthesis enzyme
MSNPWVKFGALIAPGVKAVVTVTTVNSDGTSIVALRSGQSLRVQGDSVEASSKALIQGGRIIGAAPSLPIQSISV